MRMHRAKFSTLKECLDFSSCILIEDRQKREPLKIKFLCTPFLKDKQEHHNQAKNNENNEKLKTMWYLAELCLFSISFR